MKLNELINEVYGEKTLRRGSLGPIVKLNPGDMSLWYYSYSGEKMFPITFSDMIAFDWKIID